MTPPAKRVFRESRERRTFGVSASAAGAPRFRVANPNLVRTMVFHSTGRTICRYENSVRWAIFFFESRQNRQDLFGARAIFPFCTHLFHFSRNVSPLSSARSLEMEASMSAPARSIHASTSKDAAPFLRCVSRVRPRWTRPASPGGISISADSAVGAFPDGDVALRVAVDPRRERGAPMIARVSKAVGAVDASRALRTTELDRAIFSRRDRVTKLRNRGLFFPFCLFGRRSRRSIHPYARDAPTESDTRRTRALTLAFTTKKKNEPMTHTTSSRQAHVESDHGQVHRRHRRVGGRRHIVHRARPRSFAASFTETFGSVQGILRRVRARARAVRVPVRRQRRARQARDVRRGPLRARAIRRARARAPQGQLRPEQAHVTRAMYSRVRSRRATF